MSFIRTVMAALVLLTAPAAAAKFCDGQVCYSEFVSPQKIAFRVAIPDTAAQGTNFDMLLQIVAPKTVGWAGIAWAGRMVNNPLTIAYSDGGSSVTGGALDPACTTAAIAWAMAHAAPAQPSSNTSSIRYHSSRDHISFDLAAAKIANFNDVVGALREFGAGTV
uniref:Cellobiose dehydrogenase-like cytochrome domain-containing protein n=1 Tax=Pyricularia oryzae (strain P131) TaxID=1143193 RepID=L7JF40_PYRO1